VARRAITIAQQHGLTGTATGAYARAMLGACLARTGQPDRAERELRLALPRLREYGEPIAIAETLIALGRVERLLGRSDDASIRMREAETLIEAMDDPGVLGLSGSPGRDLPRTSELSHRELEVLRVLAAGMPKRQAADQLFVSYNTLHSHVRSIYRKLDVRSRSEAVAWARREGLLEREAGAESPG
jgi:LuxR family transcriptional regulator, maltose regulon positive regulatory protein